MVVCIFCKDEEARNDNSFCSTECAFKDMVLSAGISSKEELYEYVDELFKGEIT